MVRAMCYAVKLKEDEHALVLEWRKLMRRNKTVDKTTASRFHGSDTARGEQGRMMRANHADYQLVSFPKSRHMLIASLHEGQRMHFIHAFLEADVTKAREYLHEQKARTGEATIRRKKREKWFLRKHSKKMMSGCKS